MQHAAATSSPASRPDPSPDRPETTAPETTAPTPTMPETSVPETSAPVPAPETTVPETSAPTPTMPDPTLPPNLAALLIILRVMLGIGRHLAATVRHRSASPTFNVIAACFGTGRLYAIIAHLQRGLLRATALERVLLARAARGRDVLLFDSRRPTAAPADPSAEPAAPAAAADLPAEPSAEPPASLAEPPPEPPVTRKTPARPSRPPGWNDPELFMPTLEELEAQARRRPIGRTLVDICLDLAVVPGFCTGPFWNELFDGIRWCGGSVATLMRVKTRRQKAFCQEQDRKPGSNWDWLEMGREALRRVLGFCIGEAADEPFDPVTQPCAAAAAVATGPP